MHHHQNLGDAAALAGMMPPYETMPMFEPPKPRFIFKMPRVVPDQKSKYDTDELFRRLSRESEVRYTGYRERAIDERRMRFVTDCRKGYAELSFVASGTNLHLYFNFTRVLTAGGGFSNASLPAFLCRNSSSTSSM